MLYNHRQKIYCAMSLLTSTVIFGISYGQNYVAGAIGLYSYQFNAATTIGAGGSVLVSTNGNWVFGGNVTSADKGNDNAPTAIGRSETITFDGTGNYTGAAFGSGTSGFMVDGYAAASNQAAIFTLPVGNGTAVYAVTVPGGAAVTAAYFNGSGSTQSKAVNGLSATEYSPYIDMPAGIPVGIYTVSYPAGFSTASYSSLLSSGNTSSGGTNSSTAYTLLATVANFISTAGISTATLPATPTTQVYFSTSTTVLPVTLISFKGVPNGCTANLDWQTASESNSSYYGIEASKDGTDFSPVGKVASKNSVTGSKYSFEYPLGSGINYFRLKAVDNDGKFSYSTIVPLIGTGSCSTGLLMKVFPNPITKVINIQGLLAGTKMQVFDSNGKKLTELTLTGISQTINVSSYAKGVYILRIETANGDVSNLKVMKQ